VKERKAIMLMNGGKGDSMDLETGDLQQLLVSLVHFVIYLSGLFCKAEENPPTV